MSEDAASTCLVPAEGLGRVTGDAEGSGINVGGDFLLTSSTSDLSATFEFTGRIHC